MAFLIGFRHILRGSSSLSLNIHSQFASIRLNSTIPTLTSPKLFISGLSRMTTDESLFNAFAPFGRLLEAKVIVDRGSGRSKGFGFVTYDTVEEAEKAREGLNAKYLDGWVIFVDPARPRETQPRQPPKQDTLPTETAGFTANKTVGWTAKVIVDRGSGRSKGFGFGTYDTVEEAEKAREGLNAKYLDGGVIFVDPARPRETQPRQPPKQDTLPTETAGFTANKTVGWNGF